MGYYVPQFASGISLSASDSEKLNYIMKFSKI